MAANPYEAPQSRVADIAEDVDFQPIKMWSSKGRIGRLRYLAYTFGASMVVGCISAVLTPIVGAETSLVVTLLSYIPLMVFCILAGIQRSHDMNWTGWSILLSIIPFVGLIWIFKAGTNGANDYGGPPPPNTTGVKILAFVMPLIVVIGILAAIAIPAYQDYTERAQQLQPAP